MRILLPTDFSENSIHAIHYALDLFDKESCDFFLLHVEKISQYTADDLITSSPKTSIYNTITSQPKEQLKRLSRDLEARFSLQKNTLQCLIDYDVFTDAINQAVSSKHIDLIVMGTNGATNAKEIIFGSNTIQVIRKVSCPVLTIPSEYKFQIPKNILFALESVESLILNELKTLIYFIKKYDPKLNILEIRESSEDISFTNYKQFFSSYYKDDSLHITFSNKTLLGSIQEFQSLTDVDMVALFVEQENFLKRLFQKNDLSKIGYDIKTPLLILHHSF